jgi:hypothetical protein
MITKLIGACYAVRSMAHISDINTLKSIFYAYFNSVLKYGTIFGGNSSNSGKIFTLLKKTIGISCRSLPKQLETQSGCSQCILPLMNFIISKQDIFQTNSSIHSIYTRNKHFLHKPIANLSCLQKSTFWAAVQIFNNLQSSVTSLKNDKAKLKAALRKYLHTHSFDYVDEFFMCIDL